MQPRDHLSAARRWAKFPATILFVMGVVWLLQKYFEFNWETIGEVTDTGVGALWVFTDMMVIPLGSLVIGVCVLFLQRWSLWAAGVFPLLPLFRATIDLFVRISNKFNAYNSTGDTADFGNGVMTAIEVLAIWVLYLLILFHLRKALYWHRQAKQWVRTPVGSGRDAAEPVRPVSEGNEQPEPDDVCLLMPDFSEDDNP